MTYRPPLLRQQPEKWSAFTSFLSHCQGRRKNAAQWDFLQVLSSIIFSLSFSNLRSTAWR